MQGKGGIVTDTSMCVPPGTGNHMLEQVGTTTYSGNQHVVGGREGVLAYIRMTMDYDQTISKGFYGNESRYGIVPPPQ